jgi:hypothetical protein
MNINAKILSIPPYISTSWKNIASLHVQRIASGDLLIITLISGARIEIPHIDSILIDAIFTAHAEHINHEEKSVKTQTRPTATSEQFILKLPLPLPGMAPEELATLLQHDPTQAHGPDLPRDVLDKITEITQSMAIEDSALLPQAEQGCNCMRCQIAHAMQNGLGKQVNEEKKEEEVVSDEDLTFRTWDVAQENDKLYLVTNPLEVKEQYHVYLGDPIGCTCGNTRCEHIQAVLKT